MSAKGEDKLNWEIGFIPHVPRYNCTNCLSYRLSNSIYQGDDVQYLFDECPKDRGMQHVMSLRIYDFYEQMRPEETGLD